MQNNMLFVISYITYSMYHYIYFNTCISFSHVSLSVQPPQKSIWSNIMFLHIWTVILMYYVYGNKIIVIVIIVIVKNYCHCYCRFKNENRKLLWQRATAACMYSAQQEFFKRFTLYNQNLKLFQRYGIRSRSEDEGAGASRIWVMSAVQT